VPNPPRHVLVIGAGLAGLAAASRLTRSGSRVSVLECEDRPGGRLAGERVEGYALEPVHALTSVGDRALQAWIAELGLRDEMLPPKPMTTAFAGRDGLRDVELRTLRDVARIPGVRWLHAARLVRLPRLLARYGGALELGAAEEAEQYDDRSLADFARLYFGASVLEGWIAPIACAGSLGDPTQMSRVQFLQHFRAHGLARPGVLRGPWEDLIERAAAGVDVVTRCRVERIEPGADGGFRALAVGGESYAGDAVVLATPAPLAAVLADPVLTTPERKFLSGVRYAPSFSVAAALCRPLTPRARRVIRREPDAIPGVRRGRATQRSAQSAPSLRVAAKKRVCGVARLASIPDTCCAVRLASIAFWPGNAYAKASPTGS
jgi:phytoene dehydrogenase-like protein